MQELLPLVEKGFGDWLPESSRSGRSLRAVSPLGRGTRGLAASARRRVLALYSGGDPQSVLILPQRGVGSAHPDRVALDLIADILAGGLQSRAQLALRHSQGATYGVSAQLSGNAREGILQIATAVADTGVSAAVKRLERELDRLRTEPVDRDELERARARYRGRFYATTTEDVAEVVASWFLAGLDARSIEELERLADAVDEDALLQAARKYLDPMGDVVIVGNFLETSEQLEELGSVQYFQLGRD